MTMPVDFRLQHLVETKKAEPRFFEAPLAAAVSGEIPIF